MAERLALFGGPQSVTEPIPPWPIFGAPEREALLRCFDSGEWFLGPQVEAFEKRFSSYQDARFGVATTSGTTALETIMAGLQLGAGDEVILPPYTFMASAAAILKANAVPIFCDVDPETFNIHPELIESHITDKTRAILLVHFAGLPVDMDKVKAIAKKHHLLVIEDACHAWGTQWKGVGVGALGDAGAFSFQMSKNVTSGEGGIALTNQEDLAGRMCGYSRCDRGLEDPWYGRFAIGHNLRMTELQAAILFAMMDRMDEQVALRERNAGLLDEAIKDLPGFRPLRRDPGCTRRSHHLYICRYIQEEFEGIPRAKVFDALQSEGVPAYGGYPQPLYNMLPLFKRSGSGSEFCPVACPHHGPMPDYSTLHMSGVETVCKQAVWMRHSLLLGSQTLMEQVLNGFRKVRENASALKV